MRDVLEANVVIVGTGAAGMTVAGEALRHGCSVIMIEAGNTAGPGRIGRHLRNDTPFDDQIDDFGAKMIKGLVYHGLVEEQEGDVAGFSTVHAVGGRMTLWFNNCPEPAVDERSAAIEASAWPAPARPGASTVERQTSPGAWLDARGATDRAHAPPVARSAL